MNEAQAYSYALFTEMFLEAVLLYNRYRTESEEVSNEACAHRAVAEVGLPTGMQTCPVVTALLRYTDTESTEVRGQALKQAFEGFHA